MSKSTRLVAIHCAARSTVNTLQQLGFTCGVGGDFACSVYGSARAPKNVDIVIFSPSGTVPTIDVLKNSITRKSNHTANFFIVTEPGTNRQILRFSDSRIPSNDKNWCDVELIYSHEMAPLHLLRYINGFPLLPLPHLLLHKLLKWEVVLSLKKVGRQKVLEKDIEHILRILETYAFDGTHFDQGLYESSKGAVSKYRSTLSRNTFVWGMLGFETEPLSALTGTSTSNQAGALTPSSSATETGSKFLELQNPTRIQMVCLAGKTCVDMLNKLGLSCAIFGSLACFLYGNVRPPNDVDILVMSPPGSSFTTEYLKSCMVELDPVHFYLVSARDPQATYRILYFRLNDAPGGQTPRTSCKVDIVSPGIMHLPALHIRQINWDEGIALVPFPLLLLQKLQGWDDHRTSIDELKRLKQATDVSDLQALLRLSKALPLMFSRPWSDRSLFSERFEALSRDRVRLYCFMFPQYVEDWKRIGFET